MNFKKWGLQLKLSVPIALISTLILGLYGFYSYQSKKTQLNKELQGKLTGTMNRLKKSLVQPFLDMEDDSIKGIITGELKEEDAIVGIQILEESKEDTNYSMGKGKDFTTILLSGWQVSTDLGSTNSKEEPLIKPSDGRESEEILGHIKVFITYKFIKERLRKEFILIAFIVFLIDFFLIVTIFILLKLLAIRPLEKMTRYADAFDIDNISDEGLDLGRKGSEDELDNLADSFNDMRTNLKKAHDALQDYATNLENKVEERTKEIEAEKEKVAALLNNMRQAVFSIDNNHKIVSPVSSFSKEVFGRDIEGTQVFNSIYKDLNQKEESYAQLKSALGTIFGEDDLQYDLMEDYFIQKAHYKESDGEQKEKMLQFSYNPMYNKNDQLDKLMFIVEDVTELERLAAEKAAKDEEIAAINEIASSKISDVKTFILGAHLYIENSREPLQAYKGDHSKSSNLGEIFRNLHTLKGNSRIFGLSRISQATHIVENDLVQIIEEVDEGKNIEDERIDKLFDGFIDIEETIEIYLEIGKRIFSFGNADEITVKKGDIEEIQSLIGGQDVKKALYCIKKILFNSFLDECNKFKKMVGEIAEKLDKKAELTVSGEDIFLENKTLDLISDALTHILRNSIDHGIETIEKRKERNKEDFGTINILTKDINNTFEILIVDDGNGIDGDRVMNSAVKKGALAKEKADAMNDDDKVNLIFLPNLSTAESVSEVSGRGVGMDVVKSNIEKLGGNILVTSKLGEGTTFKISFPSTR